MERGVLTYILVFISGIAVSNSLATWSLPWLLPLILLFSALLLIALLGNKWGLSGSSFLVISHLILFFMGFGCDAIHRNYFPENSRQTTPLFREGLRSRIQEVVQTPQEQAVLIALTLGDNKLIPKELKKAYGDSGAMHILALSGLHMSILYGFVSGFLFFLNTTRRFRILKAAAASLLIVLYGYITGFPPSVQRAILMILLQNILYLSGRKTERIHLIAATAFILLIIHPSDLFSISFQLSFAAVLGIALIFPVIEASFTQLYPKLPLSARKGYWPGMGRWIRKGCYSVWCLMGISISCQIATLPFTWFYFQSAPEFFLLTNLAAIPISSAILYLFIPAVLLLKVPFIGELMGGILRKLLELLNDVIQLIG